MPDKKNTVWGLDKVPTLPVDQQVKILTRLQQAVHDHFDMAASLEEENDKLANMLQERTQILAAILPFFENQAKNYSILAHNTYTEYANKIKKFKEEYEREQAASTINNLPNEERRG